PRVMRVSVEGGIIFGIVVMLGFILAFAIGVETGRRNGQAGATKARNTTVAAQKKIGSGIVAPNKPYAIQLVAYRDRSSAVAAVNALKARGIAANVQFENNIYTVCTGSYKNREEAQLSLKRFVSAYNGAFIRKR
ncbi:MAG: SPOR domain-containing protein, partial [Candidatus Omnitrophica bacterium]|nr:SPOR domain-containing protein [Candidatus Omnitrophota bacterium]